MAAFSLCDHQNSGSVLLGDPIADQVCFAVRMTTVDDFVPAHPALVNIWHKLSPQTRAQRFACAKQRLAIITEADKRSSHDSTQASSEKPLCGSPTTIRRLRSRFRQFGFDGLFDLRLPVGNQPTPEKMQKVMCAMRRADPNVSVEKIVKRLRSRYRYNTSPTTVKRVLKKEGLARPRGPARKDNCVLEQQLQLGGMKLVEVALEQTGYLSALTMAVAETLSDANPCDPSKPVDRSGRDEYGRFLASYNERYRNSDDKQVGPGFASVEIKRQQVDMGRLHVKRASSAVIERKLLALMTSPLLGNGRWDGIRVPRGGLLEELCGVAYMPSTLDLFTRELKYVGVANTMWETHALLWMKQTATWGSARNAAVLFIDETNKPIWTDMFSQSSKVSNVGRVMPSLESVCFHSGYGVPLWMITHSGRMPLVKAVPKLLDEFSALHGEAEIGRIVIIDAEGNSVPFLKQLQQDPSSRAWITRFKPSLMKGKKIVEHTPYKEYRDGDRIRHGLVELNDPEQPDQPFRCRVVEIERRTKGTKTYLGASLLLDKDEWDAAQIADLYFERWPKQEANFRAVNQAVKVKQVHGYGKQLVDNVAVVTKLDELHHKTEVRQCKLVQSKAKQEQESNQLNEQREQLRDTEIRHDVVNRQLRQAVARASTTKAVLREIAGEQKKLTQKERKLGRSIAQGSQKLQQLEAQIEREERLLKQQRDLQQLLESRRHILKHDVELDSLFSVLKVGLVLTIQHILNEYFNDARMNPITFLERVAPLPARLGILPEKEILTFAYNVRDPEVMALLETHCDTINALALRTRSGRLLEVHVESAPPPRRPAPARAKSKDRFHPG